jgi:GT2 family glycosyltransferase/glycosyltransferase involved in cell wall biosynthesis
MAASAHELLTLDEAAARPAWAQFDAAWYLDCHKPAHDYCEGRLEDALAYYLDIGVQLGDSPSPLFDEAYYLAQNPDVHELVKEGQYRSGFDHFCQHGHRILSPHWLFDDALYGRLHDDMSLENLDQHGFVGRYDHYLRTGQHERRVAHYMFDAGFYRLRAIEAGADVPAFDAQGPYVHYLRRLRPGAPEPRPSIYFEPRWYLESHAGLNLESETFRSALEHYLRNETPEFYDPVPQFSEAYYRAAYRDVTHAIETGTYRNGFQHFVQFGAFELRRPRPEIDLVHYRDANPRVQEDLRAGRVRDAFAHLRLIGLPENFSTAPADALPLITEPVARQMFVRKARDNLLLLARRKLDFTTASPALSVVMVAFNKFELTMLALTSLRDHFSGGIELILIDNGSTDETRLIGDAITGAKILRLDENIGYLRAANRGLELVTAPALLYLNNDVELSHGAITAALARLDSDPAIGAVCAKVLRSHGALQEAGCIIWRDGATSGYLRDAPADAPAANFVRDVDFGSAVFLLCRTQPIRALGGFDEDFSPAYYEDADLCLRLRGAGHRIIYDPAVTLTHLEFGSAQNSESAMALMRRGRQIFRRKHRGFLLGQPEPGTISPVFARSIAPPNSQRGKRILFLEDTIPLRHFGSGFVRANDIVRALAEAGHEVSVFPINGIRSGEMRIFADFPDNVEILHDQSINVLDIFLRERAAFYDLIWISRTHNLTRVLPLFEEAGLDTQDCPIVLDTEAIVTMRDAAAAIITGRDQKNFNVDAALRAEFAGAGICRHVTAVSRFEVDILNAIGLSAVSLLGTAREPALTAPDFANREGLLFVASIHRQDSPNLDALLWYVNIIMPALAAEMATVPVLNFVGYVAPEVDLSALENQPELKIHGRVGDLTPFYASNRVFIAPTRFAAGTPYKLYEGAAFGLPIVATDLLARQLGWAAGHELLTAPVGDPRRFAAQIALLYRTEILWRRLRENAAARLAAENSKAGFTAAVQHVLDAVLGKAAPAPSKKSLAPLGRRAARNPVPVGERLGDV